MLAIGTGDGPPDLETAVRLAEQYPFIQATVGVHPNDAPKINSYTLEHLTALLQHPKVAALGEIGLDYHWGVPRETQLPVFEHQLELAAKARKPIVIHTRDAWNDTLDVLRLHWAGTGLPCVMHCFTGNAGQAEECLELGFYLSFGGIVTFPKSVEAREAARKTPSDRILIETDAPYLAPVPYRGKRNEPAFVVHTANRLAEVRGISVEELASETTKNFEHVFNLSGISSTKSASNSVSDGLNG